MFPTQPAVKSYFFGKGYRDLGATINASWTENLRVADGHWKSAQGVEFLPRVFALGAGLAVTIFGTAFFLALSAIHAVVLGLMFVAIYVAFSSLWLFERAWLAVHGFFTVCPNCHSRRPLPDYLCTCGAVHSRLIPSSYGILHRRCNCGASLPATFFLNRGALASKCQDCSHFLSRAHTEARKVYVPVIGGPSTGKTAYLTWLVSDLAARASAAGCTMEFIEDADRDIFKLRLAAMQAASMPAKTVETTPSAVNVLFSAAGGARRNLYLYDPAGEAFSAEANLVPHGFLNYCSGILFLIDPFSIAAVQQAYGVTPETAGDLRPSLLRPDDLLERLVFVLEKHFHLNADSPIAMPIAIVLTKVDAFDLGTVLANAAPPSSDAAKQSAPDPVALKLREWGMVSLVEILEARFSRRGYFASSAVGQGHRPGGAFHPQGISEPFDWLMSQAKIDLLAAVDESRASKSHISTFFGSIPKATVAMGLVLLLIIAGLVYGLVELFGGPDTSNPRTENAQPAPDNLAATLSNGTAVLKPPPTAQSGPTPQTEPPPQTQADTTPTQLEAPPQADAPPDTNNAVAPTGPSFPCVAPTKWAEVQVCASANLADKDRRMADLYRNLMLPLFPVEQKALRQAQRDWLRKRDLCQFSAAPIDCLDALYNRRLASLAAGPQAAEWRDPADSEPPAANFAPSPAVDGADQSQSNFARNRDQSTDAAGTACRPPVAPSTVDGTTATREDMTLAHDLVIAFIHDSDRYQSCLLGATRSIGDSRVRALVQTNQIQKEQAGAEYNAAVRLFNERN